MFWIIWPFFGFYLIGSFKSFKVQIGDETIENGICPYWSLQIVASRKYKAKKKKKTKPNVFLMFRYHADVVSLMWVFFLLA